MVVICPLSLLSFIKTDNVYHKCYDDRLILLDSRKDQYNLLIILIIINEEIHYCFLSVDVKYVFLF